MYPHDSPDDDHESIPVHLFSTVTPFVGRFLAFIALGLICFPCTFLVMILLMFASQMFGVQLDSRFIVLFSYPLSGVILSVFGPSREN